MQASEPDKGAVPMEVYRLEAPDLAVTYRRRTSEVTLDNDGTPVDVDFGGGIRKRYEVIAPIVG